MRGFFVVSQDFPQINKNIILVEILVVVDLAQKNDVAKRNHSLARLIYFYAAQTIPKDDASLQQNTATIKRSAINLYMRVGGGVAQNITESKRSHRNGSASVLRNVIPDGCIDTLACRTREHLVQRVAREPFSLTHNGVHFSSIERVTMS